MNTHIFAGHAQLPEGTDIYQIYKYVSIVMEIDMDSGKIVDCMMPVYCRLTNDYVTKIIIGKFIDKDIDAIIDQIEKKMHTLSKRALITSIQTIHNRYSVVKKNSQSGPRN